MPTKDAIIMVGTLMILTAIFYETYSRFAETSSEGYKKIAQIKKSAYCNSKCQKKIEESFADRKITIQEHYEILNLLDEILKKATKVEMALPVYAQETTIEVDTKNIKMKNCPKMVTLSEISSIENKKLTVGTTAIVNSDNTTFEKRLRKEILKKGENVIIKGCYKNDNTVLIEETKTINKIVKIGE